MVDTSHPYSEIAIVRWDSWLAGSLDVDVGVGVGAKCPERPPGRERIHRGGFTLEWRSGGLAS